MGKHTKTQPEKPYPEFPLTLHRSTRRWCKKVKGKQYFFGPQADPDGALKKYLEQRDYLQTGQKPPSPGEQTHLRLRYLVNHFMAAKKALVESGERAPRTVATYKGVFQSMLTCLGDETLVEALQPDDFRRLRQHFALTWGPHRLSNAVTYVRGLIKHAFESGLIDKPVRTGLDFKKPAQRVMRLHRAEEAATHGKRVFKAADLRRIIAAAPVTLRAMILLGVNCGMGNADCGKLRMANLDLNGGWLDYPRPKTGVDRRCKLWPETVKALRAALAERPEPLLTNDAQLVFLTRLRTAWVHDTLAGCPISRAFKDVLDALDLYRPGLSFYTLRHTFRTVADGAKDQVATGFIMGHADGTMAGVYREEIDDARLAAVAAQVRKWLFAKR